MRFLLESRFVDARRGAAARVRVGGRLHRSARGAVAGVLRRRCRAGTAGGAAHEASGRPSTVRHRRRRTGDRGDPQRGSPLGSTARTGRRRCRRSSRSARRSSVGADVPTGSSDNRPAIDDCPQLLRHERRGDCLVGSTPDGYGPVLFGGVGLAVTISAACANAPARSRLHSLHAHFLRPVRGGVHLEGDTTGMISLDHAAWFHSASASMAGCLQDVQSLVNWRPRAPCAGSSATRKRRIVASMAQECSSARSPSLSGTRTAARSGRSTGVAPPSSVRRTEDGVVRVGVAVVQVRADRGHGDDGRRWRSGRAAARTRRARRPAPLSVVLLLRFPLHGSPLTAVSHSDRKVERDGRRPSRSQSLHR